MVVVLDRNNAIFIDKQPASEADVKDQVAARVAHNPKLPVLLTADKEADVTRFLRLLDLVKQADAENVVVATQLDQQHSTGGKSP
jgi:biopolymer transport protein ExbD